MGQAVGTLIGKQHADVVGNCHGYRLRNDVLSIPVYMKIHMIARTRLNFSQLFDGGACLCA
jgi:hypothetical protein